MISETLQLYVTYFSGLFLILITPGPNIIMIGCLSALYGVRSIMPLLLGITAGQIVLAVGFYGIFAIIPEGPLWSAVSNALAALFMLIIAWQLITSSALFDSATPKKIPPITQFISSFITAVGNPITGLYLASQFLGPLKSIEGSTFIVLLLLSILFEFIVYGSIGLILSHPSIRSRIKSSFRLWTRAIACVFFLFALLHLQPVIAFAGGSQM
jgi:threonine/homoserine/homoserine lactone efflux protein